MNIKTIQMDWGMVGLMMSNNTKGYLVMKIV